MAQFVLSDPRTIGVGSPWATQPLTKVVLDDLLGINHGDVGRGDLMQIPAFVRGRGLIVGTLAKHPLTLWQPNPDDPTGESDTRLPTSAWMTSTTLGQSPRMRMVGTLDDLIVHGLSVWATKREDGAVVDAARVQPENWTIDPDTLGVLVNGVPADPNEYIVIEGAQEGLVSIAQVAARSSRNLANALAQRVKSPIPLVELHNTDPNDELDEDEILDAIADWETARQAGGTAYTPAQIEARIHGNVVADLFVEGRNAERLDWANLLQLPAALLDGSTATASLTYSTAEGKRSEYVDYSLSFWTTPIEARLSQDDMTPPGTFCRFDLSWLTTPTQPGTSPAMED